MLLARRDQPAHAVGEDLRAAARQRAEPGVLQLAQHLLVREPGQRRHVVDLGRGVELQVDVGQRLVQRANGVDVEVEADVRVLAVHHVDLGEAGQLALAHRVLDELVGRDRVGVLLLPRRREGAELALHAADVRLVQIEVLDEVDLVRAAALPPRAVGEVAEREQVVALEEREAVLEVEPLAGVDLLADRVERGRWCDGGDSASPVHDGVGEGLELFPVEPSVEARPGLASVVEGHLPGALATRRSRRRARARPRAGRRRARRARPRPPARRAGAAASASPRAGRCPRPCRSRSCRRRSRGCRPRSGRRSRG